MNKIDTKKGQYTYEFVVKKEALLLDFLLENLKSLSRNNVKNILKNKCVLVDGFATTQFDYQLAPKMLVQISKNPVVKSNSMQIKLDIIYEDNEFVAINKPSGLLSVADDNENQQTAFNYVSSYLKKANKKEQIFIVHRIDKDTSGVLLFCKNKTLRDAMQDEWNTIVKEREYYALVEGLLKEKEGTIKSYLAETKTHIVFSSKGKEGKLAITNYKVVKEFAKHSLLKVNIDSGRKNQIRVHLKEKGYPIVGDVKYGTKDSLIDRLGLHASKLVFIHPFSKKKMTLVAKVPQSFLKLSK